ncbi:MAG: Nif3-like dinuclear metal center hexameric protein [Gammaproteobacteria bacterium]|nr:Nif3-like dinuclear metal center hexameric protein [Gammaproteobacteria bacterium]
MVELKELVGYCNELLNADAFEDYAPNGLQLDAGRKEINRVVTGVTASQALIDASVAAGADLLLVHHGFFWPGEPQPLVGVKGRRIRTLIQAGLNLMAYHLPLDVHPELGNNYHLGDLLGIMGAAPLSDESMLWSGTLESSVDGVGLAQKIEQCLGRAPLWLDGGSAKIDRIGWCSGAAQGMIQEAAGAGLDAFISGEVSEQTTHLARELGIHYFAAGHHATERGGVVSLGNHLSGQFGLDHQFIDIPNPV